MRYYNIPIFLPELACPFRCVYCNQYNITGKHKLPDAQEVKHTIDQYLASFTSEDRFVEVAFFGGNFTGLPLKMQDDFLRIVQPYLENGLVDGIRCSTRPDYIDFDRVKTLKSLGMKNIELGAQTTNDLILQKCGRGHSFDDIAKASEIILENDITLGLQMMLGLPFDSFEDDFQTARDIVRLGARETRIYPCIVVKDTELERLYKAGDYRPLSIDDAVDQSASLYEFFTQNNVKVLRIGLHTSSELDGQAYIAGPYHKNFAEMVYSRVWSRRLDNILSDSDTLVVEVPQDELNHAIGYRAENKAKLLHKFNKVVFKPIAPKKNFVAIANSEMPAAAKEKLRSLCDVVWLDNSNLAYKSIASHPDIFFFCKDERCCKSIVCAANTPPRWIEQLENYGVRIVAGDNEVGKTYPDTVHFNAVGIGHTLIHNIELTDAKIIDTFDGNLIKINVRQGYTRCNLLALNDKNFVTSDLGIKRTLENKGFSVFYVDPRQIMLPGHDYGFFPGCCGIMDDAVVICGSLKNIKEGRELKKFIRMNNMRIIELYDGKLVDVGSVFFV